MADVSYADKKIGVVTDLAEQLDLSQSEQAIFLIQSAGFNALKETLQIATGQQGFKAMSSLDQLKINNSLQAAQEAQQQAIEAGRPPLKVELYLWDQAYIRGIQPPVRPNQERGFCKVGAQIIAAHPGVVSAVAIDREPNNPFFSKRQFNPDGTDAAAINDEKLTTTCYDIIKAVDPNVQIIGEELSASGNDNPNSRKPSHAPLTFIRDFCNAYKASGRTTPVMDVFSIHYYPVAHSNPNTFGGVSDIQKVESVLNCFQGTAQPIPPIELGEGGETTEEPSIRWDRYHNNAPGGDLAVSEAEQGQIFANEVKQVVCYQPDVTGIYNFLLIDDGNTLDTGFGLAPRIQRRTGASANMTFTPKAGFSTVKTALTSYKNGTLCS
ncbi:MAG: hypothetical protein ACREGG_01720 [Candidatus Saccharimonadales bacterium]